MTPPNAELEPTKLSKSQRSTIVRTGDDIPVVEEVEVEVASNDTMTYASSIDEFDGSSSSISISITEAVLKEESNHVVLAALERPSTHTQSSYEEITLSDDEDYAISPHPQHEHQSYDFEEQVVDDDEYDAFLLHTQKESDDLQQHDEFWAAHYTANATASASASADLEPLERSESNSYEEETVEGDGSFNDSDDGSAIDDDDENDHQVPKISHNRPQSEKQSQLLPESPFTIKSTSLRDINEPPPVTPSAVNPFKLAAHLGIADDEHDEDEHDDNGVLLRMPNAMCVPAAQDHVTTHQTTMSPQSSPNQSQQQRASAGFDIEIEDNLHLISPLTVAHTPIGSTPSAVDPLKLAAHLGIVKDDPNNENDDEHDNNGFLLRMPNTLLVPPSAQHQADYIQKMMLPQSPSKSQLQQRHQAPGFDIEIEASAAALHSISPLTVANPHNRTGTILEVPAPDDLPRISPLGGDSKPAFQVPKDKLAKFKQDFDTSSKVTKDIKKSKKSSKSKTDKDKDTRMMAPSEEGDTKKHHNRRESKKDGHSKGERRSKSRSKRHKKHDDDEEENADGKQHHRRRESRSKIKSKRRNKHDEENTDGKQHHQRRERDSSSKIKSKHHNKHDEGNNTDGKQQHRRRESRSKSKRHNKHDDEEENADGNHHDRRREMSSKDSPTGEHITKPHSDDELPAGAEKPTGVAGKEKIPEPQLASEKKDREDQRPNSSSSDNECSIFKPTGRGADEDDQSTGPIVLTKTNNEDEPDPPIRRSRKIKYSSSRNSNTGPDSELQVSKSLTSNETKYEIVTERSGFVSKMDEIKKRLSKMQEMSSSNISYDDSEESPLKKVSYSSLLDDVNEDDKPSKKPKKPKSGKKLSSKSKSSKKIKFSSGEKSELGKTSDSKSKSMSMLKVEASPSLRKRKSSSTKGGDDSADRRSSSKSSKSDTKSSKKRDSKVSGGKSSNKRSSSKSISRSKRKSKV
jgi:hypothetical protein